MKVLPICLNPKVKMFLHHALPLSIILAREENINYLHANYIQLYKETKNKYLFDFYPRIGSMKTYGQYLNDNILENHILTADIIEINKNNLIQNVMNWIDNGFYVQINCDESKIKGTPGYNKDKLVEHPALYYGYNEQKNKLSMLNFNHDYNFTCLEVDYEMVIESIFSEKLLEFQKKKGINKYVIQLRRVNEDILRTSFDDKNTIIHIKKYLVEYLLACNLHHKNAFSNAGSSDTVWGVEIYKIFKEALKGNYANDFIFQNICGLVEHKSIMLDRFRYLRRMGVDISNEMMKEQEIITYKMEVLKNKVMKSMILQRELREYVDLIEEIVEAEEKLLTNVLRIF